MNVDQIVDKKTVAIPGPMGPVGPRGLPGPGATPADEAVAAYVADTTSKTRGALDALRPPVDIVHAGVPNDGSVDVADMIQRLIDGSQGGVTIPAGIYKIGKPLTVPTRTQYMHGVTLAQGAHVIATQDMDYMMWIGYDSLDAGDGERQNITGGTWHANGHANDILHVERTSGLRITDMTLLGARNASIMLADTGSLNIIVDNISINSWNEGRAVESNYGIYANGADFAISNCDINYVTNGIYARGFIQVQNVHIWSHLATDTCGIWAPGGMMGTNLYFDGMTYGIRARGLGADGQLTSGVITVSNVFHYTWGPALYCTVEAQCWSAHKIANVTANPGSDSPSYQIFRSGDNYNNRAYPPSINRCINLSGSIEFPDGAYVNTWESPKSFIVSPHTHASGDAILMGWLPNNTWHSYVLNMIVTNLGTGATENKSVGFNTDSNLVNQTGTVQGLKFGIGSLKSIDGNPYNPIYLYDYADSLGAINAMNITILPTTFINSSSYNPIYVNNRMSWKSGITKDMLVA